MHSGIIKEHPDSTDLENIVGTLLDDGLGEMTSIGNNLWTITLRPEDYYNINANESIYRLGMYFRDENNVELGYGFRDQIIYIDVLQEGPIVWIEPSGFATDESITVYFDATAGNAELIGSDQVYMHSGLELEGSTSPWLSGWMNVIGVWGADTGLGEMTKVTGEEDLWRITFTPSVYYNIDASQEISWICAVFRNADGSVKGTGDPGPMENGIIHIDQDYFIRNAASLNVLEPNLKHFQAYPNPFTENLILDLSEFMEEVAVEIYSLDGKRVFQKTLASSETLLDVNTNNLLSGIYLIKLTTVSHTLVREVLKL